jgi:hypothetical protein
MTYTTPEPIISGMRLPVVDINGKPPSALADLVDQAEFTIDQAGHAYQVKGFGLDVGGAVRFHEKDLTRDGKDIRVWQVTRSADGQFIAEHLGIF